MTVIAMVVCAVVVAGGGLGDVARAQNSLKLVGTVQEVHVDRAGVKIAPPAPLPGVAETRPPRPDEGRSEKIPAPPRTLAPDDPVVRGVVNGVKLCGLIVAEKPSATLPSPPARSPAPLKERKVELRWTAEPLGQVSKAEVVAVDPLDGDVLACAKRKLSQTDFGVVETDPPVRNKPTRYRTELLVPAR